MTDKEVAQSYVDAGLAETLEEAMDMLEIDGLLDWQQKIVGWDTIEPGEENA